MYIRKVKTPQGYATLKSSAVESGDIKTRPLTVAEAMQDLLKVEAVPVQVGDREVWIRTEINAVSLSHHTPLPLR